jgi:hypothetical protein
VIPVQILVLSLREKSTDLFLLKEQKKRLLFFVAFPKHVNHCLQNHFLLRKGADLLELFSLLTEPVLCMLVLPVEQALVTMSSSRVMSYPSYPMTGNHCLRLRVLHTM